MKRYVTLSHKPNLASWNEDPDAENYLSRTVYEPDTQAIRTGLLNAQGNDIYYVEERDPIGFVHWDKLQA